MVNPCSVPRRGKNERPFEMRVVGIPRAGDLPGWALVRPDGLERRHGARLRWVGADVSHVPGAGKVERHPHLTRSQARSGKSWSYRR